MFFFVLFFSVKILIFFLFLNENIYCWYPLEMPHEGASKDYPLPGFFPDLHFGSFYPQIIDLGPVVQSVVSLRSSLRVISLTVLADSIHNILIFLAEKM